MKHPVLYFCLTCVSVVGVPGDEDSYCESEASLDGSCYDAIEDPASPQVEDRGVSRNLSGRGKDSFEANFVKKSMFSLHLSSNSEGPSVIP